MIMMHNLLLNSLEASVLGYCTVVFNSFYFHEVHFLYQENVLCVTCEIIRHRG